MDKFSCRLFWKRRHYIVHQYVSNILAALVARINSFLMEHFYLNAFNILTEFWPVGRKHINSLNFILIDLLILIDCDIWIYIHTNCPFLHGNPLDKNGQKFLNIRGKQTFNFNLHWLIFYYDIWLNFIFFFFISSFSILAIDGQGKKLKFLFEWYILQVFRNT